VRPADSHLGRQDHESEWEGDGGGRREAGGMKGRREGGGGGGREGGSEVSEWVREGGGKE
jgi:hypothetical protein